MLGFGKDKKEKKLAKINKKLSKKEAKKLGKRQYLQMKEEIKDSGGSLYYACGMNALVHSPDHHEQLCKTCFE